jgi:small-conductance mechanosensitive channel
MRLMRLKTDLHGICQRVTVINRLNLIFWQTSESAKTQSKIVELVDRTFFYYVFDYELFRLGETPITIFSLLLFFIAFLAFIFLANFLRKLIVGHLIGKANDATSQLIGSIFQYFLIFLGFIIALQIVGVQLTSLSVLIGAVGVGIGFGLQNVASNFISGLIIILERPFQVGDRIEVGSIKGKVIEIGGRSTRILNDDQTINIVPNQKLISDPVRNFRRQTDQIPQEIKIFVGYGNDAKVVLKILEEVAASHPQVLPEPSPEARFKAFDVGTLDFVLNVWRDKDLPDLDLFLSEMNVLIYEKFLQNGITIRSPIDANVNLPRSINESNANNEAEN